jgi:anaerobic magnesium-protoporphyrin IX monomethyl ester cyclase
MKEGFLDSTDLVLIVPYQEIAAFGVRIIDSYLRQKGYNVVTLYFKKRSQKDTYPTDREVSLLVNFVKEVSPLMVGFSVMSPFNTVSRMLTRKIRHKVDVPIIWGGVHPTVSPEDCIDNVDALCLGDGEEPLRHIIEGLRKSGEIDLNAPNCWVNSSKGIIKNDMTYMCKDLDILPYTDLSGKNVYFINNNQIKEEDPYITYIRKRNKYDFKAFRGCPFRCTYCGNKAIIDAYDPGAGRYMRKKSVDRVIGELKYAIEAFPNIKTFHSYDESFISDEKYTKEFSEKYKEEINLPFTCDVILALLTEQNVSYMAQAGLKAVNCGIEAFSEDVREKIYRRKISNKKIIEKAWILNNFNIHIIYDFIHNNPLESAKDIEKCFWNLIVHLPRPCSFNNYSLSHLPKTELTDRFLKEGRITKNDIVGVSEKGLVQWKVTSNYQRNKKILFWIAVYNLFGIQIKFNGLSFVIPLFVVKFIAHSRSCFVTKLFHKLTAIVQVSSEGKLWSTVKTKFTFFKKI